jgi:hypothetical protein
MRTLEKAELLAKEKGFGLIATIIAGEAESGLITVLLQAIERGDEKTVPLLLCVKPDGEKMPDGTIYAGKSAHSGKRLLTTAADAPPLMTFENAVPLRKASESARPQRLAVADAGRAENAVQ